MRYRYGIIFSAVLSVGCAAVTPEKFTADKTLYEYANRLYADKEYTDAITFFESLKNRFPQSPHLIDSELKIADAYYEKESYAEAEINYQTFRALHPTNPKIPHVLFRLGMSHVKRIPGGSGRDQTQTELAIGAFEELIAMWPASPEAAEAQPALVQCKKNLAERELYIADFYLKRHEYAAAVPRLETVRSNPDVGELWAAASYKLGYAHYKLENRHQAADILSELSKNTGAAEEYRAKAKALLKHIGKM